MSNLNTTSEYCPYCDNVVELNPELKVQVCPNCGKHIVTCSMCTASDDTDHDYCSRCCLVYQAKELNSGTENELVFEKATNKELIRKVNELWSREFYWFDLSLILSACLHRDGSTILEELGAEVAYYGDEEEMIREVAPLWFRYIADDIDLKVIVDFMAY